MSEIEFFSQSPLAIPHVGCAQGVVGAQAQPEDCQREEAVAEVRGAADRGGRRRRLRRATRTARRVPTAHAPPVSV